MEQNKNSYEISPNFHDYSEMKYFTANAPITRIISVTSDISANEARVLLNSIPLDEVITPGYEGIINPLNSFRLIKKYEGDYL